MSSIWTKVRKNTPEIDCGLCGFTTCGAFARSIVVGKAKISACPVLGLNQYAQEREELENISRDVKNTQRPAPEQPEGGVLLSKPCTDSPDLLMAEMRIFNGVKPGEPMKYGVLDPVILCWFLDCVSSRYEDMRCSKELAYAWGNMEEIRVHILRDGRVRMRRARGADHALDSFRIIERTVMGSIICNCCGRDLLTILAGFAEPEEEYHTVLEAGSTLSLDSELVEWTPKKGKVDTKQISEMIDFVDDLYNTMIDQLDLLISGNHPPQSIQENRAKICKIISLMVDPLMKGNETIFLRGLSLAFFIDSAIMGLSSLSSLMSDGSVKKTHILKLLNAAKKASLKELSLLSMDDSETLSFTHSHRVERAIRLYEQWSKD